MNEENITCKSKFMTSNDRKKKINRKSGVLQYLLLSIVKHNFSVFVVRKFDLNMSKRLDLLEFMAWRITLTVESGQPK